MTDSTDPKKGEGAEGASPEGKNPDPKTEPKTVPVKALAEARAEKRELKDEVEELKAELARLKEQSKAPADKTPVPDEAKAALQEIQQFRQEQKRHALARDLNLDGKQIEAVEKVLGELPNLNPKEALTIASLRNQELFESHGRSGFDPSMHGALRPTAGSQPNTKPPDTLKTRIAKVADIYKTGDRVRGDAAWNEVMGAEMAKVMEWEHPLNKQ